MKYYIFFLFALGLALPLAAQQGAQPAPSIPPLPPGPLLNRAPSFCRWTVMDQGAAVASAGTESNSQTAANDAKKPKVIRQESVTKTGAMVYEQLVDDRGRRFERWHSNGVQILIPAGEPYPIVFPDFGGDDIYTPNYQISDFAGLDWISEKTYSGIQKVMGRDCLIFRGEVSALPTEERREVHLQADRERLAAETSARTRKANSPAQASPLETAMERIKETVPAVACIDLETRLPIAASFGPVTRAYQYGTPPAAMLVLPPQLVAALREYTNRISNLSSLPAAP